MDCQRQGGKNYKNFYSQSEVFFHSLEHWAGYTTVPDWAFRTAKEIMEEPTRLDAFCSVKHKVISLLFLARLGAFVDLEGMRAVLLNQPSEVESKGDKKTREKTEAKNMDQMLKRVLGSSQLNLWEQENVTNFKEHHKKDPNRMEWNLRHAPHPSCFPSDDLAPIFTGLSHTHLNWMASTNKTNHAEHRKRILKAILKEQYFWGLIRRNYIEQNPPLFSLFSQLLHTINSIPLLQDWSFWLVFHSELEKEMEPGGDEGDDGCQDSLDKRIQDQDMRLYQAERKEKLGKLCNDFMKSLAQAGLCGIQDEEDKYLLHPALAKPLKALQKVIILLPVFILSQHFFQTILNVQHDVHRASLEETFKSRFKEDLDDSDDPSFASWEMVKNVYGPDTTYRGQQENKLAQGEGNEEEARNGNEKEG